MAKPKQQASKTTKKRSTKYSKLAAVCSKELSAKKAALVRAEKALAKAQKTHSDLLSEVARLDMLDRSLKALINGTEPPQNVRYVYSYPQWVWQPGWSWNGYTYTTTLGNTTVTTPSYQSQTGLLQSGGNYNLCTTGSNSVVGLTSNSVNLGTINSGYNSGTCDNSSGYTLTSSSVPSNAFTLATPATTPTINFMQQSSTADLTVDLSSGAANPDCNGTCEPACEKCAVTEEEAEAVSSGK